MKLYDLQELNKDKVLSLRNNIGLIWHHRLAHVSKGYLETAAKMLPELKGVKFDIAFTECEICKKAKMKRVPPNTVQHRYEEPLKLVHTDLMGPISPGT